MSNDHYGAYVRTQFRKVQEQLTAAEKRAAFWQTVARSTTDQLARAVSAWQSTIVEARRQHARAETAEAALAALHEGEEPYDDERVAPTPGQWISLWNRATLEERLSIAANRLELLERFHRCVNGMHEARIAEYDQDRQAALTQALAAETERDGAYRERAHLVAWLAALYPAVLAPAPDVDEPGWQILYLTAAGRQLSWHIAPSDAELFRRVERVAADDPRAQWDGHTTAAKYGRIRRLTTGLNLMTGGRAVDPATRAGAAEARIAAVRALADRFETEEAHGGRWGGLQEAADRIREALGPEPEQPAAEPPPARPCRPGFCRPCRTIHERAGSPS
jgi:hypothetical protein